MPESMVTTVNPTAFGRSYTRVSTVTGDNEERVSTSLPVAKIGQLTTRTNNTDGTLTMNPSHGIITGNLIDLFWVGGKRSNVVVGTVATNSVPFTGGNGDNLPTNLTAITAMVQNVETCSVVGANVQGMICYSNTPAFVNFKQANGTLIYSVALDGTNVFHWDANSIATNPVTGQTIGQITTGHGDSAAAHAPEVVLLFN